MSAALDELYLQWLYRHIGSVRIKNPDKTYWNLARQLYDKEFVWFVPNDDNRAEDGRDLRDEFVLQEDIDPDDVTQTWMELPCSMLELILSLSRHLAFETDGEVRDWFWRLIDNLDILIPDSEYDLDGSEIIDEALEAVIHRDYDYDGHEGGLFPLRHARHDQTKVELWYQLNEYLMEEN